MPVTIGKQYASSSNGISVVFTFTDNNTVEGIIQFPNHTELSAAHIHKNVDGKPGPILIWLATSDEWEAGVAQQTPLANSPCCANAFNGNPNCTANAPPGTYNLNKVAGMTLPFKTNLNINSCNYGNCSPLDDFDLNLLNVHGKNFQYIQNGCVVNTNAPVGIDSLGPAPLLTDFISPCPKTGELVCACKSNKRCPKTGRNLAKFKFKR